MAGEGRGGFLRRLFLFLSVVGADEGFASVSLSRRGAAPLPVSSLLRHAGGQPGIPTFLPAVVQAGRFPSRLSGLDPGLPAPRRRRLRVLSILEEVFSPRSLVAHALYQ